MKKNLIAFLAVCMFMGCSKPSEPEEILEPTTDVTAKFTDRGFQEFMMEDEYMVLENPELNKQQGGFAGIEFYRIDANGDGHLTVEECEAVKRINVNFYAYKVYNLNGIRYCKNITHITVYYNYLSGTLDLGMLEKLEYLDIRRNTLNIDNHLKKIIVRSGVEVLYSETNWGHLGLIISFVDKNGKEVDKIVIPSGHGYV